VLNWITMDGHLCWGNHFSEAKNNTKITIHVIEITGRGQQIQYPVPLYILPWYGQLWIMVLPYLVVKKLF
jgi:hypothetical protein